jgi:hypothetical protein
MLRFHIEWEKAAGVRDRLLRATWARLEISARDGDREVFLTRCLSEDSQSLRRGVYGSVFPLVTWIVENWWSIFHESLRGDSFRGGRSLVNDPSLMPWFRRHCLLAGRGGYALPDLALYRDGAWLVARCVPDPTDADNPYPVRFVNDEELRPLPPGSVEQELVQFVDTVIGRVQQFAPNESEGKELIANWNAIRCANSKEAALCSAAAAMGLDPYDPDELSEELSALIAGPFQSLPPSLRDDLAEATTGPSLPVDLDWVRAAGAESGTLPEPGYHVPELADGHTPAHVTGYQRARQFVDRYGRPPVDDLIGFLHDRCGWSGIAQAPAPMNGVASRINAMIAPDADGKVRLTPSAHRHPESNRFLVGRALFFAPSIKDQAMPRLITRASSWPQRASRAFAAELLAPSDEIGRRIDREVDDDQIAALAHEFGVSPRVIGHQIENHQLARIVDI